MTATMETHDTKYIQFLQESFGTTSIPFFGSLLCMISFILILLIFIINSSLLLIAPVSDPVDGQNIKINGPISLDNGQMVIKN